MSYNNFGPGTVIDINGAGYFPQGYAAGRLLLVHPVTGEHFRCDQDDGSQALPTDAQFDDLLGRGDIQVRTLTAKSKVRKLNEDAEWTQDQVQDLDRDALRKLVICRLLDDAGVPNGDQAIANHLRANWTKELIAEHGPHDPPRTIRSWRV